MSFSFSDRKKLKRRGAHFFVQTSSLDAKNSLTKQTADIIANVVSGSASDLGDEVITRTRGYLGAGLSFIDAAIQAVDDVIKTGLKFVIDSGVDSARSWATNQVARQYSTEIFDSAVEDASRDVFSRFKNYLYEFIDQPEFYRIIRMGAGAALPFIHQANRRAFRRIFN